MAITYPLSLPSSLKFETHDWREVEITSSLMSPFTGQSVEIDWGGGWLAATLTSHLMYEQDSGPLSAFITSLRGHIGYFWLPAPRDVPLGTAAQTPGSPKVYGNNQSGRTLNIDGAPANATGYLVAGDYLQLPTTTSSRLHKVLNDVNVNSSGQATIDIWPGLRETPVDNDVIVVSAPKGLFRRALPTTEWRHSPGSIIQRRSFEVEERLK